MALYLLVTSYAVMAAAGLAVDLLFRAAGLVPRVHHAVVVEAGLTWNYTSILNLVFLALAAVLVWRFVGTGGREMLRMMNAPAGTKAS